MCLEYLQGSVVHRIITAYGAPVAVYEDKNKWSASCNNQCSWNIFCDDFGEGCLPYVGRAGPGGVAFEDTFCRASESVTDGFTAGNTGKAKAGSVLVYGHRDGALRASVNSRVSWGQSVTGRVFNNVGFQVTGPGGVGGGVTIGWSFTDDANQIIDIKPFESRTRIWKCVK